MKKKQRPIKRKSGNKKDPRLVSIAKGLAMVAGSVLLTMALASYHTQFPQKNLLGTLGYLTSFALFYFFGLGSFLLPLFGGYFGALRLTNAPWLHPKKRASGIFLFSIGSLLLIAMSAHHLPFIFSSLNRFAPSYYFPREQWGAPTALRHYLGGLPAHYLYVISSYNLNALFGALGSFLIFSGLTAIGAGLFFDLSFFSLLSWTHRKFRSFFMSLPSVSLPKKPKLFLHNRPFENQTEDPPAPQLRNDPLRHVGEIKLMQPQEVRKQIQKEIKLGDYTLPSSSCLTEVKRIDQTSLKEDLKKQALILEETLASFGLEAKVGDIHCGPTITSFEVHPAFGVKVQKIKALENDIALNMQARSIRIIAPIPGKAAVGVEVPNPKPQEVSFRELLENHYQQAKKANIPLLLGKKVNGDDVFADLSKMPHLIIAGATGSGKSVCINTIVMSIVMNCRPDEVKLVMVDPKKVELTAYTHLPHMLAPVITEPKGSVAALNWLVKEMEKRYEIFRQLGIRNIQGFNSRARQIEIEDALDLEIPEKMPYIVVIIDELADLMLVSNASDIETPIARIAQMARAIGIHMILATQRPSREVITGLIKANFPCRIAFKVSSRVNSQIIIDENGAESLLGNGDMLFLPPGSSTLIRAQGAFIRDEDINKVIHHTCKQAPTNYLIPNFDTFREEGSEIFEDAGIEKDALFEEAKRLVYDTGTASTTFMQRKLKIGYARAASLMDQLELNGIVGPSQGAKPREIFYPSNVDDTL